MAAARPALLVLVVDDEPAVCAFARKVLAARGHEVVATTAPRRWREACGTRVPDVAVVDQFMPEQDGLETMRAIREAWPQARIVAVSGSVPVATKSALLAAGHLGADRVLAKPFTADALVDAVEAVTG